jgi:hypothetical protein
MLEKPLLASMPSVKVIIKRHRIGIICHVASMEQKFAAHVRCELISEMMLHYRVKI